METATFVNVTPPLAEMYLERNGRNRNIRPDVVSNYARDMSAHRWQITGEAIKLDADGNLLDGQHRLRAVIKSGETVTMLVIEGLPPEAQRVMDSGKPRTAGDADIRVQEPR